MSLSRRAVFAQVLLAGFVSMLLREQSAAQTPETVQYTYDVQGRLTRATYANGVVVEYSYDASGNRTQVVTTGGLQPPSGFTQTIAITGSGPVNLRTLANNAGYNGAQNATVTYTIASNVTLSGAAGGEGAAGGIAIDTGTWPTGSYSIALTLQVSGRVYGGGGGGGFGAGFNGTNGTDGGQQGGAGGDSIYCRLPLTVTVNAGGEIKGGGGGGGGGGAWLNSTPDPFEVYGGGGGGGGFPNGAGARAGYSAPPDYESSAGNAGTTAGGGAGGANGGAVVGRTPGNGGNGGGAAATGAGGAAATGTQSGGWSKVPAGAASVAGYAIRKNGNTVTVTNNGTITGTVG